MIEINKGIFVNPNFVSCVEVKGTKAVVWVYNRSYTTDMSIRDLLTKLTVQNGAQHWAG